MTDEEQKTFYAALGSRLRELRGSQLSQEKLAKAAGLSRTSIVNIESGRQKLLVHNLFEISRALGIKPTQLLVPLEPSDDLEVNLEWAGEAADWIQRSLRKAKTIKQP